MDKIVSSFEIPAADSALAERAERRYQRLECLRIAAHVCGASDPRRVVDVARDFVAFLDEGKPH